MTVLNILGIIILAAVAWHLISNTLKTPEQLRKEEREKEAAKHDPKQPSMLPGLLLIFGFILACILQVLFILFFGWASLGIGLALFVGVLILTKLFSNQERIIKNQEEDD